MLKSIKLLETRRNAFIKSKTQQRTELTSQQSTSRSGGSGDGRNSQGDGEEDLFCVLLIMQGW